MLETERLIIRPFELNDIDDFKKILAVPEVPYWNRMLQQNRSVDFLNWYISNYIKMDIINNVICFGIFEKKDGNILGAVGAGKHDDLNETEIFYNLLPEKRGNGYATEATKRVTEWALQNTDIQYIIGTVGIENIKSQNVLERCGYVFVNEQKLLVHIENKYYFFKYYRHYKEQST
jgi:RimJ/RimL family protein N-acetyltransferase